MDTVTSVGYVSLFHNGEKYNGKFEKIKHYIAEVFDFIEREFYLC